MKPIEDFLVAHKVRLFDPASAGLSGGEDAQAHIVETLVAYWGRLDGSQQRGIVDALSASTRQTEDAEAWARSRMAPPA